MRQYIDELFPRYDEAGKELILKAYNIAAEALKEHKRSNGKPFIEHPVAVAKIACDEIGLSAECIAAIFLHEATRFFPETDIMSAKFGQDVYTIVDGLINTQVIFLKNLLSCPPYALSWLVAPLLSIHCSSEIPRQPLIPLL